MIFEAFGDEVTWDDIVAICPRTKVKEKYFNGEITLKEAITQFYSAVYVKAVQQKGYVKRKLDRRNSVDTECFRKNKAKKEVVIEEPQTPPEPKPKFNKDNFIEEMFSNKSSAKRIYMKYIMEFHPDRHQDSQHLSEYNRIVSEINEVWDALKRYF